MSELKHYGYGIVDKRGDAQDEADTDKGYIEQIIDALNRSEEPGFVQHRPYRVVELFYREEVSNA